MPPATHSLTFNGGVLQRGFWLYIWEITPLDGAPRYYVGRTGDSSSSNAQSPFNRMGQHLGFNDNSNVLRRRLLASDIDPDTCTFRLVTHGPLMPEASSDTEHRSRLGRIAAWEKALADAMVAAGYAVLNPVHSRAPLDAEGFAPVLSAFALHFHHLNPDETSP